MKDKKPWIIIGILFILLAIPYFTRNEDTQNTISYIPEHDVNENKPTTESDQSTDIEVVDTTNIPRDAIGIIEIPSLDICYPIYEGATETQLSIGIGHLPETAGLLEKGNCVCCGHNGSSRGKYFTTLSHIRRDAEVKITTKDQRKRTYRVKSTKVVGSHDPSVRKESKEEILKLFTCAYHGTRRFVAECVPINEESEVNEHEVQYQSQ